MLNGCKTQNSVMNGAEQLQNGCRMGAEYRTSAEPRTDTEWVQIAKRVQNRCRTDAERMQNGVEWMQNAEQVQNNCSTDAECRTGTEWVQNGCRTVAEQMQNGCRTGAEWMQNTERVQKVAQWMQNAECVQISCRMDAIQMQNA